ncbi:MAG: arsenate reductase ArsC [Desulfobulbaceae bacterium]|nr:arsenate reductase ArsC [Desulfobulbaceae bacterium]
MPNILFLCTGNSCRSQMAEGWLRHLKGAHFEAWSAGLVKHGLNPYAVQVMAEAGVDISGQKSKTIAELPPIPFAQVFTLCDHAQESCPYFPGKITHRGFPDPPTLAATFATAEEKLACYRQVRDQIRDFVLSLPDVLSDAALTRS